MSDSILSGRWIVYYGAENRQKRIFRDTSVTPATIDSVNVLYSALQDLFDDLTQLDDGVPMSAQTPTEYTIGIIDAGDKDPWFIDRTSAEYLKGGALKTASWARVQDSNVGIVRITYTTGTDFITSDIGKTVTNATSTSSGTLLDFNSTGATKYAWIRPTSFASQHNWGGSSGTITVTGGSAASVTQASAAVTGESLWANVYSLGTIEDFTHLYIYQNSVKLKAYKSTTSDWWGDGQIDVLVNVKEVGTEIDEGYITVFARQYSKTYDNFIVDLSAGGRNPIPLATGADLNNDTGNRQFTGSSGANTFNSGNYIYVGASWAAATKRAKLTAVGGTVSAPVLSYYLLGDLTDFSNGDSIVEYTGTANGDATCTAGTPANIGPATYSITITHANNETFDINEDGTTENYSIVINLGSTYTVKQGYEFTKYITRYGGTTTTNTDGIEGERYIGSEYRLLFSGSITGTLVEGDTVSQAGTLAVGTVVSKNTTDATRVIILRNTRGTFNTTGLVTGNQGGTFTPDVGAVAIAPIKAAPFGTFAGGKWFCAPGVVLQNALSSDLNNYQLVDDNGNVVVAPTKVNVTVGNTRLGDRIAVFRLLGSGLDIQKDRYSATVQSAGATTLVIDTGGGITSDEPGKTTGGVLRLVDVDAFKEYRIRFASWSGSTFTLASYTGLTADASGCDSDTLTDTGQSFLSTVKVGDIIRNTSESVIAYVTAVVSNTELTTTPVGNWTSDNYEINTLPVATATNDTVYVPFIDVYETIGSDGTPGSESALIVYPGSNVFIKVRARKAGTILPFEQDAEISSNGASVNVIRTADTIFTP